MLTVSDAITWATSTARESDYNYSVVSRAIIYTVDVLIDFADLTFDTFWNDVLAAYITC